jgi:hypothetical protein
MVRSRPDGDEPHHEPRHAEEDGRHPSGSLGNGPSRERQVARDESGVEPTFVLLLVLFAVALILGHGKSLVSVTLKRGASQEWAVATPGTGRLFEPIASAEPVFSGKNTSFAGRAAPPNRARVASLGRLLLVAMSALDV